MIDGHQTNWKEKEYDCNFYEWKFRILDQPWGWNRSTATGDWEDIGNNLAMKRKARRVTVTKDGIETIYESVNAVELELHIPKATITSYITKYGKCDIKGVSIVYLDPSVKRKQKHTGVTWHSKYQVWYANISYQGKKYYLGTFTDEDEAIKVYEAAYLKYKGKK